MKSRIHLKLLMAPLSMLTLFACSPNQFQSVSEYDDVYFTSADRQKAPKVVTKPGSATGDLSQVITLENESSKSVDQNLLNKYTNNAPSEVEYFVEGEIDPKVKRANQLNYDDFISDYENELLATYALPLDWETEWDANYFDNLVYNDFEFRLAWYEQYYVGNSDRMDRYLNATTGRVANSSFGDFNSSRMFANGYNPGPFTPRLGLSIGLGFGNGFFGSFYDPFYDPFFDPFYDPFFYRTSWRFNRRNRFFGRNSWGAWNNGFGFGGFGFGGFNSYVYCPPIFSNQYIYRGEVIAARNNRTYTRGGRVQSSSVASIRSDATNGVAPTRSQRLSSTSGTRSTVSRSAIASRSERNSGRVRSTSSSGVTSSRSSRSSTSTIPSTRSSRSSRTSTDAYRFDESSRSSRSSSVRANATSGRSVVSSRTARSSSSTSRANTSRSRTTTRNSSAPTFNRSSSRSTSRSVSRPSSSSSSRGVSRSSSNRSTSSSRSSGVRSTSSSSRSGSGSVSRGSSSSSRSSSSRSGSTSSRSSSSSSKSSSSSRSGRGN